MLESKENISTKIVSEKTEGILKKLAKEFDLDPSKVPEISLSIVNGLLQYKSINKLAVIKVVTEVVPVASQLLSNLADKFYDGLLSCSEEERAKVMKKCIKVLGEVLKAAAWTVGVGVVAYYGGSVAKVGIEQHGKTKRTEIRWGTLKKFSPDGITKAGSKRY